MNALVPYERPSAAALLPAAPEVIDLAMARRFFDFMAEGEPVTFQTFHESSQKRHSLAGFLHGDLDEHAGTLGEHNAAGDGICWMVNYGDGKGRGTENVTGIRAVFVDLDGPSYSRS